MYFLHCADSHFNYDNFYLTRSWWNGALLIFDYLSAGITISIDKTAAVKLLSGHISDNPLPEVCAHTPEAPLSHVSLRSCRGTKFRSPRSRSMAIRLVTSLHNKAH